jgi:diadenosine tetraphosphatase ApaH/serine/threonine PP2A family protein phosphatase
MFAVISDVHSNLEALFAVLDDLKRMKIKDVLFLGDAVGYGPDPNECVSLLRKNCGVLLAGNHDRAALDLREAEYFNPFAQAAIVWTAEVLSKQSIKTLHGLPVIESMEEHGLLLVHSSPFEPERWHYISSPIEAADAFDFFSERICLVGHSHIPFIVEKPRRGKMRAYGEKAGLHEGSRYLINAGSVGQPRDGDPRACYVIVNDEDVEFKRVSYSVSETQKKMAEAGLPDMLIERLSYGK